MPLDPLMKDFLDQMALQPTPKLWEMPPALARETMIAMTQLIGPKDVPIGKVVTRAIPAAHGEIPIRVYTPVAGGAEPMPAMVYFHGGGWVIGNLDTHDGVCRILANESRCRIVAVDYRLSPEHKFPAAVEDAFAAVSWIESNASDMGIDANRLAVGGDSAGGALAAVVAQMAKEKGKPKLSFQLLFFPVTQIGEETISLRDFAEGFFLEAQTLNWFYDHYLDADADKNDPRISPLRAKTVSGLPPAYVMVAGFDPLHDEGVAYAEKLREAGVAVTLDDYPDLVHDFILMQAVVPQAKEALVAAAGALKSALKAE